MATAYFQNLPVVSYGNQQLRNILVNARMSPTALQNASAFYPYTLKDGETPQTVAFDYYGDIEYVWLVYFSNDIIDPVTQWFKTQDQFKTYMISLYGSVATAQSTIHHYANLTDLTYPQVSVQTFGMLSSAQQVNLTPIYAWDWYDKINQSRRMIRLVDRNFKAQIALELEKDLAS